MDRVQAIEDLSEALGEASVNADWNALSSINAAMAAQLPALAAHGPWSAPERAALRTLRALHAQSFQLCSDEKQRLSVELGSMQANKEGWLAYALISEAELDGN